MANPREKILVVENDPITADLITRQALAGQGFEVKRVEEASAAIQQAMSFEPDVVIANLDLPGLSGKDLITALSFQNVKIPVIVISSSGQEKDVIRAFRVGASDFISMPIRETEVLSAVERALQRVRARKERERLAARLQMANQELNTRVEQLTSLFAIGQAVTMVADQKKLFKLIVEEAVSITQADYGWFLNLDERFGEFVLRAQVNLPKSLLQNMNKPWDDGISSLVARSGETFSIHGKPMERFMLSSLGKSALVVPIKARQQTIGLLVVMRKSNKEFQAGDQAMLEGVADYAAISLVNARLFQALDDRAVSLQAAVDKTQHEKRMNEQVIFLVNQELRSSLVSATNYLNQIMDAEQGEMSFKQAHSLELAQKSLDEITRINQTMEFLQEANASGEIVRLNLAEQLQTAVERSEIAAQLSKVTIEMELPEKPVFISGDKNQMLAVLDALISNAIRLGREGGRVITKLQAPSGGSVELTVANDGVGVTPDKLERIFSPFSQSDSSPIPQSQGLGVGLALVKEVVAGHGGKIWVDGKTKKGIKFYLSLPQAE
jgi:signal transduction histidine kinase/DNA-binding response OmpR family regulator